MTNKQKQLVENYIRLKVRKTLSEKKSLKEDNFQSIEATEQERTGIFGLVRQIIQNCEILQKECKDDSLTVDGIEAYFEVVNRNNQRIQQFLNKKRNK